MKILELRLKNLNSLYGEWCIDFTDPEYTSNGIFALTGPTGAGKSTLLDAISLALYGRTPRLEKVNKGSNEIMSLQTGECYAKVLLEAQGKRYRCHWEQRRARKSPTGNLQDQEHQIIDAETGTPLETKKSLVSKIIIEKLGMDFEQFTRSTLLAQGGFDKFLKAGTDDKSAILEQITGTGIYTEISQQVHERSKVEKDKLDFLKAETKGIEILEAEDEKAIRDELVVRLNEAKELEAQLEKINKAIHWHQGIDKLKQELSELAEAEKELREKEAAFVPRKQKLELARKAAQLEGPYATLKALRRQQTEDTQCLQTAEKVFPEKEAEAKDKAEALKTAENKTASVRKQRDDSAPVIRQVRSMDQSLEDEAKSIEDLQKEIQASDKEIDRLQTQIKQQTNQLQNIEDSLKESQAYLEEHAKDAALVEDFKALEEQFHSLQNLEAQLRLKQETQANAQKILEQALPKQEKAETKLVHDKEAITQANVNGEAGLTKLQEILGGKAVADYEEKRALLQENIEQARLIQSLEEHRQHLEDNKPCPLCGSLEHPFASGNLPNLDQREQALMTVKDVLDRAKVQTEANTELEKEIFKTKEKANTTEKEVTTARYAVETAKKALSSAKTECENLTNSTQESREALAAKLKSFGIEGPDQLPKLKDRLKRWKEQTEIKNQGDVQKGKVEAKLQTTNELLKQQNKITETQKITLDERKKAYTSHKEERQKLYGDKQPNTEEDRLQKAVAVVEMAEKAAREQHTAAQQTLNTVRETIEELKKSIQKHKPELDASESDFNISLGKIGFSHEAAFIDAQLSTEIRDTLEVEAKGLERNRTELSTRHEDRKQRLEGEQKRNVTQQTFQELEPSASRGLQSLKELNEDITHKKYKLEENAKNIARIAETREAIDAQQREVNRWSKLHELIGSNDGKKFRNFAQGLTFELMVSHANQQLQKMTDRYLLIRDKTEPLDLDVVDNYQAGENRSAKNLSGGESFIVSLALALGLSSMASRKVRIDSFFLDEGFGTLDEESLETAIDTLSGLHEDGKLIGIISHVGALKDRISTQISVIPNSHGHSSLSGPGITSK